VRCPCGSGETYDECCGPLHRGAADAPTARALMASRFSAFAVRDEAYLLATWHPSTRPSALPLSDLQWRRLEIIDVVGGGPFDSTGIVEFRAYYRGGTDRGSLRERSKFVREDGRWYYVDAVDG
jgi:SEC-C motif-containing protein